MAHSILISVLLAIVSVITSSGQDMAMPPYIIQQPASPYWEYEHSNIELSCGVRRWLLESTPECPAPKEYQWWWRYESQKDAIQVKNQNSSSRMFIAPINSEELYGQSLIIKDFQQSDEKDYVCVVECTNGHQYISDWALFFVKDPDSSGGILLPQHKYLKVHEGANTTLQCDLRFNDTRSYTLTHWKWHIFNINDRFNLGLSEERHPSDRIQITRTSTGRKQSKQLTINNLQRSDTNLYSCCVSYITSRNKEVREMTVTHLSVREKPLLTSNSVTDELHITAPFILKPPRHSLVEVGSGHQLTCGIGRTKEADPIDKEVYWQTIVDGQVQIINKKKYQDRVYITTLENPGEIYGKILNIDDSIYTDEREYQCVVKWGRIQESYPVLLHVLPTSYNVNWP